VSSSYAINPLTTAKPWESYKRTRMNQGGRTGFGREKNYPDNPGYVSGYYLDK